MTKLQFSDLDPEILALAMGDWGAQDPLSPLPGYFPEVPEEWLSRHNRFLDRAAQGEIDVLFLGDSITEGWSAPPQADLWATYFAPLRADNFGIGGDRTQQVLWRIDQGTLDGIAPKVVVLLIGVNNLWSQSHSAEQVAAGIRAVIDRIQAKLPETQILLQGILPTGQSPDNPLRSQIREINGIIATFAHTERIQFIDFGATFLEPDGTISPRTMPDFCHLSTEAYAEWTRIIEPPLRAMLSDGQSA
jgi:lysophospholipase L1-like esterase